MNFLMRPIKMNSIKMIDTFTFSFYFSNQSHNCYTYLNTAKRKQQMLCVFCFVLILFENVSLADIIFGSYKLNGFVGVSSCKSIDRFSILEIFFFIVSYSFFFVFNLFSVCFFV